MVPQLVMSGLVLAAAAWLVLCAVVEEYGWQDAPPPPPGPSHAELVETGIDRAVERILGGGA